MNPLVLKILIGIGVGIVADILLTPKTRKITDGNLRKNGDYGGTSDCTSEQSADVEQSNREHLTPVEFDDESTTENETPKPPIKESTDEVSTNGQTVLDVRRDRPSDDLSSEQFADAEKPSGSEV